MSVHQNIVHSLFKVLLRTKQLELLTIIEPEWNIPPPLNLVLQLLKVKHDLLISVKHLLDIIHIFLTCLNVHMGGLIGRALRIPNHHSEPFIPDDEEKSNDTSGGQ